MALPLRSQTNTRKEEKDTKQTDLIAQVDIYGRRRQQHISDAEMPLVRCNHQRRLWTRVLPEKAKEQGELPSLNLNLPSYLLAVSRSPPVTYMYIRRQCGIRPALQQTADGFCVIVHGSVMEGSRTILMRAQPCSLLIYMHILLHEKNMSEQLLTTIVQHV